MAKPAQSRAGLAHMHGTRNNLPDNAKTVVLSLLNARLADGIDLALATKQVIYGKISTRKERQAVLF